MPTFFAKVFSRGKEREKEKDGLKESTSPTTKQAKRASIQSLLEGKFEAVSPTVSPSVKKFEDRENVLGTKDAANGNGKDKEKEKDRPALFRPKSRPNVQPRRPSAGREVPLLSLDLKLPSAREDAAGRDFELVVDGGAVLDDAALSARRLSAEDALKLMRACAAAIVSRGLGTLGVMHPHWHSASPAVQRKLISLFLASLDDRPSGSAEATVGPSSPTISAAAAFDSELEFARSPHDVSAVFRWALRHLRLDGDAFAKDDVNTNSRSAFGWYDAFARAERERAYPQTAYSELLVPAVKPPHVDLLNDTLGLVSRLASHSEMNGVSGSKLSMFLGHYLLTGNNVDGSMDWQAFYSQWERAGRALEHIFLASLRDEASRLGIPKRLSELTAGYPYSKYAVDDQFPRPPRFATRSYDALYIQIATEQAAGTKRAEESLNPTRLVETALNAELTEGAGGNIAAALWEDVKNASSAAPDDSSGSSPLSRILSDDSIRLLSLSSEASSRNDTPRIAMFSPIPEREDLFPNESAKTANGSAGTSRKASGKAKDESTVTPTWSQFSSIGFGEPTAPQNLASTLLDSDLEKTKPPALVPRRSLKRKSRSPPGRSERPPPPVAPSTSEPREYRAVRTTIVKLDESFVDFWSDALTDAGVTRAWPHFAVCQLRADVAPALSSEGSESDSKKQKLGWLVIEARTVEPRAPVSEPASPTRRASSPRPSERSEKDRPGVIGRVSATFGVRKRFNLFGGASSSAAPTPIASGAPTPASEKRESKTFAGPKVGELGEAIPEESIERTAPEPTVKDQQGAARKPAPALGDGKKDVKDEAVPAVAAVANVSPEAAQMAAADSASSPDDAAIAEAVEKMAQEVPGISAESEPPTAPEAAAIEDAAPEADDSASATAEKETLVKDSAQPSAATEITELVSTQEPAPIEDPSAAAKEQPSAPFAEPDAATIAAAPAVIITDKATTSEAELQPEAVSALQSAAEREGRTPGAGDSRFVEHMETPPDEKPKELELSRSSELGAVAEEPAAAAEEPAQAASAVEHEEVPATTVQETGKVEEAVVAVEAPVAEAKLPESDAGPTAEAPAVAVEGSEAEVPAELCAATETGAPAISEEVHSSEPAEEPAAEGPETMTPEEAIPAVVSEQIAVEPHETAEHKTAAEALSPEHQAADAEAADTTLLTDAPPVVETAAITTAPATEVILTDEIADAEISIAVAEPAVPETATVDALSPEQQAADTEAADTTLMTEAFAAISGAPPVVQTASAEAVPVIEELASTGDVADVTELSGSASVDTPTTVPAEDNAITQETAAVEEGAPVSAEETAPAPVEVTAPAPAEGDVVAPAEENTPAEVAAEEAAPEPAVSTVAPEDGKEVSAEETQN